MAEKRVKASYDWSGKRHEISQQITKPSNLKIIISQQKRVAAANRGEKGVSRLFLIEKMVQDFSANHKAERLKKTHNLKQNREAAASGGKRAVSKILITIIISKL